MDYSVKGIVVLLQDLQRIHFGKVEMVISTYTLESGPMVNCCVFDSNDEPHNFCFYTDMNDKDKKAEYQKIKELVYENTTA